MTTPARDRSGPLGPLTIAAGATGEFRDFRPPSKVARIALHTRSDQPGDLWVYRVEGADVSLHLGPIGIGAMGADDPEDTQVLNYPLAGTLRIAFENTSASPALVQVTAAVEPI